MMNVKHHPSADVLTSFAAGGLPLSHSLCVSTHLEHCSECRQTLRALEGVGGELFEDLAPKQSNQALKSRVLDAIRQNPASNATAPAAIAAKEVQAQSNGSIPKSLRQFVKQGYDSLKWRRISASMFTTELCREADGARVELLKIMPGGSVSTHTHLGDEYTVILEGSFSDEDGLYRQGDFMVRDASQQHKPVATKDKECICLIVTYAPIQFTGWFTRWLNPFLRRSYAGSF